MSLNGEFFNAENAGFLEKQMLYSGFGEIPKNELHDKLKEGKDEFQLVYDKKFGKDSARALLNFKKSDKDASMFFFNSFDLLLKKEGKEETLQRNFSVFYGNAYTLREAYNMLDGRSVGKTFTWGDKNDKELRKQEFAWEDLDFISVDERGNYKTNRYYDYDIEKVVDGYPIKGLEFEKSKEGLISSLKKGNRVSVIMNTSKGEQLINIEANPSGNSLNLYNDKHQRINLSEKGEVTEKDHSKAMENNQENSVGQGETTDDSISQDNKEIDNSKNVQNSPVPEVENGQKEEGTKVDSDIGQSNDLKNKETVPDPGKAKKAAKKEENNQSESNNKKRGARTRVR